MAQTVVALDIGHSAVKGVVATSAGTQQRFFVPSVVCSAIAISDEAEARRAEAETVSISPGASGSYFFGETAMTQGAGAISGLSEDWISSREHAALLVGVMKKIKLATKFTDKVDLVMGLPTSLYQSQKEKLEALVKKYVPEAESLKIIPQAMGPLYRLMLDGRGHPSKDHSPSESWGVVEVGYYSSDFMMTKNGRWAQSSSDICSGVRLAAEHVRRVMSEKGIAMSLNEAEVAIQSGVVKSFGKKLDISDEVRIAAAMVATEVVDTANRLMESYARQLDGVLVAGGGASLVFEQLKAQWPHAVLVEDSRFSVAEGMVRMGLARAAKRAAEAK